jgi:hypothetical protein
MKIMPFPLILAGALGLAGCATPSQAQPSARLSRDSIVSDRGFALSGSDRLSTPGTFKPPVEITVVAKTDSTNLRLAYAADHVIFNWEGDQDSLRIVGGPADGRHKDGAGRIPVRTYVTIRWVVTPQHQAIYVDDQLRFEHEGDYSRLNRCVSVFPELGSTVTVKSIKVKQIPVIRETPMRDTVNPAADLSWPEAEDIGWPKPRSAAQVIQDRFAKASTNAMGTALDIAAVKSAILVAKPAGRVEGIRWLSSSLVMAKVRSPEVSWYYVVEKKKDKWMVLTRYLHWIS